METVLKWKYVFLFIVIVFGCKQKSGLETNKLESTNLGSGTELELAAKEEPELLVDGSNLLVDERGNLTSHTLVKDGRVIYIATYNDQEKTDNKLMPWIQDSFLFEDKYYLKVFFPFPYPGKMRVELDNDPEYVLTPIEDQKFQVVINHALDLNRVDFRFYYQPAATDTLVETAFSYSYVIMDNGER